MESERWDPDQIEGNRHVWERLGNLLAQPERDRPVAFVGAGVSAGLYPLWSTLIENLSKQIVERGGASNEVVLDILKFAQLDPPRAADELERLLGSSHQFLQLLVDTFNRWPTRCTEIHEALLALPLRGYVTTNYDRSLDEARRRQFPEAPSSGYWCTHSSDHLLHRWLTGDIFDEVRAPILYAHGSLDAPAEMVLGESSYERTYVRTADGSDLYLRVFEGLWLQRHLIIVGFSFSDPWISRSLEQAVTRIHRNVAAQPRHVVILPTDLQASSGSRAELRRSYRKNFNTEILFFPVGSGVNSHQQLKLLLLELGCRFPREETRISKESALSRDVLELGQRVVSVTRQQLEEKSPGLGAASFLGENSDTWPWIPSLRRLDLYRSQAEDIQVSTKEQLSIDTGKSILEADPNSRAPFSTLGRYAAVSAGPGRGKSTLARLLALCLAESTEVSRACPALVDAFPDLSRRNVPLVVNLTRSSRASVGLDGQVDWQKLIHSALAANGLIDADMQRWGQVCNEGRAIVLVDAPEDLLQTANYTECDYTGRQRELLEGLLMQLAKHCGESTPIVFFCRPHVVPDLQAAVGKHGALILFGFRELGPDDIEKLAYASPEGVNFDRQSVARIQAFASDDRLASVLCPLLITPMIRYGLGESASDYSVRGILDTLVGHMLQKPDREFRINLAEVLSSIGRAALRQRTLSISPEHILAVIAANGPMRGREISLEYALQFLASQRLILTRAADGTISFEHARYRDLFAARHLADFAPDDEILDIARDRAMGLTGVWAIGYAAPDKSKRLIAALTEGGPNDVLCLVEAINERDLHDPRLLTKVYRIIESAQDSLALEPRRDLLKSLLGCPRHDFARETVSVACPFDIGDGSATREWMNAVTTWINDPLPSLIEIHGARFTRSNTLQVFIDSLWPEGLICCYTDPTQKTIPGASWRMGSLTIDLSRQAPRLPKTWGQTPEINVVRWISEMLNLAGGGLRVLSRTLSLRACSDEWRLLVCAFAAENLAQGIRNTEKDDSPHYARQSAAWILEELDPIPDSVAPAFVIGLCNALLSLEPVAADGDLIQVLLARRKHALSEHLRNVRATSLVIGQKNGIAVQSILSDEYEPLKRSILALANEPPIKLCAPPPPFWKRFVSNHGHFVHKLKAKDGTRRWAYYFVLVTPLTENRFIAALKSDETIDLEDFGMVISSNYGEEPSDDVRRTLYEEFGFEIDGAN